MKKMLILGGSKGIGKACAIKFDDSYQVVTVARSHPVSIKGDITDGAFRNRLLDLDPDIVINSIGRWGDKPYASSLHVNAGVAVDLMLRFYDVLREGSHIINISSLAGNFTSGWKDMSAERINYMAAKQAMSAATSALAQSKRRDIRVTTIEPGEVHPTNFGEWKSIPETNYSQFSFDNFTPYRPADIADVISWVLDSPPWFGISRITLNNHCRDAR